MANSKLLTKEQTCPGPRLCSPFEMSQKELKSIVTNEDRAEWVHKWARKNPNPVGYSPSVWFHICAYCNRLRRATLVECPSCRRYFKGPRPNFPVNYECEECDV